METYTMQNTAYHLINYSLAAGHTVSVYDGEEWSTKRSTNRAQIIADMQGVDEATLKIRNTAGESLGSAFIVNGLEPEETVADYSTSEYLDAWNESYYAANQ